MAAMKKIIECVPNFSEGRNPQNIEKIVAPFRGKKASSFSTIKQTKITIGWS